MRPIVEAEAHGAVGFRMARRRERRARVVQQCCRRVAVRAELCDADRWSQADAELALGERRRERAANAFRRSCGGCPTTSCPTAARRAGRCECGRRARAMAGLRRATWREIAGSSAHRRGAGCKPPVPARDARRAGRPGARPRGTAATPAACSPRRRNRADARTRRDPRACTHRQEVQRRDERASTRAGAETSRNTIITRSTPCGCRRTS